MKIFAEHTAEKLVAVDLTDKTAGISVVRDIGRVFGKNISYDLIDGVVAFLKESGVDLL